MGVIKNVCRMQRRTYLLVGRENAELDYQQIRCSSISIGTVFRTIPQKEYPDDELPEVFVNVYYCANKASASASSTRILSRLSC